ncbi:MAG: sensor histidine kinase [bacterium]
MAFVQGKKWHTTTDCRLRSIRKNATVIGAVLLVGAFLTVLILAKIASFQEAALIGYGYAIMGGLSLFLVHRFIGGKLTIFTAGQQWVLKALLYTVSLSFAYLIGLLFQTMLRYPLASIKNIVGDTFWSAFVYFVSSPFEEKAMSDVLSPEFRGFFITFLALIFLIGLMSLVGSWVEIRWRATRHSQALQKAELTALRSQLEPHFLFNSLNTITALIRSDPQKAEQLLVQLSQLLRYVFQHSAQERVELQSEIEFTRQYLNLLEARFGETFCVTWRWHLPDESQVVPVFLFQPIVENAIRHGWQDESKPLKLQIALEESNGYLRVEISDNGQGIRPEVLERLPRPGHALANIAERLSLFYEESGLLRIQSRWQEGTKVEIKLPVSK